MKKNRRNIVIGAIIILPITGVLFYKIGLPYFKKLSLTTYLNSSTRETIYDRNNNPDFSKTHIEIPKEDGYLLAVYKDRHKLVLLKNNVIEKEYDVNIRRENIDRAVWEDSQTPEGIFTIETLDVVSDPPWERWMRLNTVEKAHQIYKENYEDGARRIANFETRYGPLDNDVALRKFNEINPDHQILRGIGIHGGGFSLYHDWTTGCIAMSDDNVTELFDILKNSPNKGVGTKVIIQD